jgi:membrane protein implicated in regulation of membrane protease activity
VDAWPWVWLVAGAFVLLPFALGAAVACLLAFLDAAEVVQWGAFVGTSAVCFVGLWQLRHRIDRDGPDDGIGSRRLIGQPALVLEAVPGGPTGLGLVRIGREEWRAESLDGRAIPEGVHVKVVEVRGTRVRVWPVDEVAR